MTSRREALKSAALLPLAALPVRAAPMVSGTPVAGHFTHDSVRLWVQATEAAKATLRYWSAGVNEAEARAVELSLANANGLCAIADLSALKPSTAYRYRVGLEGTAAGATGNFRTAPAPGSVPADFR